MLLKFWFTRYTFHQRILVYFFMVSMFTTANAFHTYLWGSIGIVKELNLVNVLYPLPPIVSLPLIWIFAGLFTLIVTWCAYRRPDLRKAAEISMALLATLTTIDLILNQITFLRIIGIL
jgi:ABC-type branched-subunit amino acid transport system permease subunit